MHAGDVFIHTSGNLTGGGGRGGPRGGYNNSYGATSMPFHSFGMLFDFTFQTCSFPYTAHVLFACVYQETAVAVDSRTSRLPVSKEATIGRRAIDPTTIIITMAARRATTTRTTSQVVAPITTEAAANFHNLVITEGEAEVVTNRAAVTFVAVVTSAAAACSVAAAVVIAAVLAIDNNSHARSSNFPMRVCDVRFTFCNSIGDRVHNVVYRLLQRPLPIGPSLICDSAQWRSRSGSWPRLCSAI